MGKVGTWYWYFQKHNTYHTTSVQVFSSVILTIPTIPRCFEISIPYPTGSIRYFQMSYLRYQRYHGILRFRYLTIPARSGIFRCHTCDTRDTPVFWYLPYQLDQVFSNVIPTIPTRTTVWHTPGNYRGNPGKYPTRCTTHGFFFRLNTKDRKLSEQIRPVFKMYQNFRRFFIFVFG